MSLARDAKKGTLTSESNADRFRDGGDLGICEQTWMRSKGNVCALVCGDKAECISAAVAVASHANFLNAEFIAHILDRSRDERVSDWRVMGCDEARCIETGARQVGGSWGAIEEVGSNSKKTSTGEAVG